MIHHAALAMPIIIGALVAVAMSLLGVFYARRRPNA
jgi:hypothetical protein